MRYGPILPFVLRVLHMWWYWSLHLVSKHVRKRGQGDTKNIPHTERNSPCFWFQLTVCWVDFSTHRWERSPYCQVFDRTYA